MPLKPAILRIGLIGSLNNQDYSNRAANIGAQNAPANAQNFVKYFDVRMDNIIMKTSCIVLHVAMYSRQLATYPSTV